jgi:hypothetical protein
MSRAEIARKFDEIVAFSEVEKFIDTPVKHYSSGMYVRLAFAVAAHLDTEVLFVDEVLAVGDAELSPTRGVTNTAQDKLILGMRGHLLPQEFWRPARNFFGWGAVASSVTI